MPTETDYRRVRELIERHRDDLEFGDFGPGAVSEEWIAKAEARLGVRFPSSYLWFLRHYGGGAIRGREILSIYQIEFEEAYGDDIVFYFINSNERNGFPRKDQIVVFDDGDEKYCIDTRTPQSEGEYPIVCLDIANQTDAPYASNFLEFLEKLIIRKCG